MFMSTTDTTVTAFQHQYPFDPSYGFQVNDLLALPKAFPNTDFATFWQKRYRQITTIQPTYHLNFIDNHGVYAIYELLYTTTENYQILGWLLIPKDEQVEKVIIIGHGYGGREQPDFHIQFPHTALCFPCFRGLGRSQCQVLPAMPDLHVLQGIADRERYIIGGCVDDLWLCVSVMQQHFPQAEGHIGYMGISFGGGIGALGVPWDGRISKVHFNVPTFGNQPLRLSLPSLGSANALSQYAKIHPEVIDTLTYFDAATAACYAEQPAHFATALFDPVVAPPGQFAIYNAWHGPKNLFLLEAGHFDYPNQGTQNALLLKELTDFFADL